MIKRLIHRVVAVPRVYDFVQNLIFLPEILRRLQPLLAETAGQLVCEVGAGTGNLRSALPASARYVALDNDSEKLRAFMRKWPADFAVLGDGAGLALKDKSVDCMLCVQMSHHLLADQLDRLFPELARVTRGKLVFIDAVRCDRLASRLLWKYDRGSNPRTPEELSAAIQKAFSIQHTDRFTAYHKYFLCEAAPKG